MTEYSSIESMFTHFQKTMIEKFPLKIRDDIDYILLMCHHEYDSDSNLVKTHFNKVHEKFLEGIKAAFPNFDNYVVDFIFCILYYNGLLTKDNFKNALQLFSDEIDYINNYPGYDMTLIVFNDTYTIGTKTMTMTCSLEIFDFDLPPFPYDCLPLFNSNMDHEK